MAARMKIDERNETSPFSCWRAFEYQVLLREGGRTLSRRTVSVGGAEEGERCCVTGSATTWVAKVIAEIHREERRGSSEEGKRAQKLM